MPALDTLLDLFRPVDALKGAAAVMGWDRQLWMPTGGSAARGAQESRLLGLQKAILTGDEFDRALDAVRAEGEEDGARIVRSAERIRKTMVRIPLDLLQRRVAISNEAYDVWKRAKATNDFPLLAPYYRDLFAIGREMADALDYEAHPYDALLDLFEPDTTHAQASAMFDALKAPLRDLIACATDEGGDEILDAGWRAEEDALLATMREVVTKIGLRADDARLDLANNAFCFGTGRGDARLTTRASDAFKGVVSSSLHEMGHALYGTNIDPRWDGSPLTYGHGLAAHESQSRLWENMVGRSYGFWSHFLPFFQSRHPRLTSVDLDRFLRALNRVRPEPVRVGADELTYNLHILIRYELEVRLIEGDLAVDDLPEAWDALYEEHLGLRPATSGEGVLQDVHWSRGSVGYFPTYAMGNIVAGSLWAELGTAFDLEADFARGDFTPVREWLTERVYRFGSGRTAREIVEAGGGTYLDPAPWLAYAESKFGNRA